MSRPNSFLRPSTVLDHPIQKQSTSPDRPSYFISLAPIFLGFVLAGFLVVAGYFSTPVLNDSRLCLVLDDDFTSSSLDDSNWSTDDNGQFVSSGFQSYEQQSSDNLYLSNSNLYIVPTFNGSAPVSARIYSKQSIQFGKILIRAKLPTGQWLLPSIYLLPQSSNSYGPYPASGLINILNARGNSGPAYPARVGAHLTYGPLPFLEHTILGSVSRKRAYPWSDSFHDYVLEWDPHFIRVYLDKPTIPILEIPIGPLSLNPFRSPSSFYFTSVSPSLSKPSFWDKAAFPLTVHNSSDGLSGTEFVVQNPYSSAGPAAPFDQKFFLVIELAVGGLKGVFPDGLDGKPWLDAQSLPDATEKLADAKDTWLSTWPEVGGRFERAFRIDHIKMWERC